MADTSRPTPPAPTELLPPKATFTLTSTDLTDGQTMPDAQVHEKGNTSPQLSWSGAPEGTVAYAVSVYDPDAPTFSGFWHWMVVGIPAEVTELPAGAGAAGGAGLPKGAVQLTNDFGDNGYGGAAPPPGDRPHRYVVTVHALGEQIDGLDEKSPVAQASFNAVGKELARATLTVTYQNA